jgi:hypothetical protein
MDFSGLTNPKRVINKRLAAAGEDQGEAPSPAPAASQSSTTPKNFEFTKPRPPDPDRQKKLIEAIRRRDAKYFKTE